VCHDAGAANLVLADISVTSGRWLPVMEGPARHLWEAAGRPGEPLLPLETAVAQARWVLTGTGWGSDLEHRARRLARAQGLRSVAIIDHWVNYEARFERSGEILLPDEIWVVDEHAHALARSAFPMVPIQVRPNRYLEAQVAAISSGPAPEPGRLLYLLEPLRYGWPGLAQPGEFEALDFLVAHLGRVVPGLTRVRLRPHPSDPPGKYGPWLARSGCSDAVLDDSPSLSSAIARAEWVAGCETAALAIALAAGRKVLTTLPPQAPRCRLPHPGLVHLRDLPGVSWPAASRAEPARR